MTENENKNDVWWNIFQELSGELDFGKVNQEKSQKPSKWADYYMRIASNVLAVLIAGMFLYTAWVYMYSKIQNDPNFGWNILTQPFCFVILWDLQEKVEDGSCPSLTSLKNIFTAKTQDYETKTSQRLEKIFVDLYKIDNFSFSPEVSFLMENKVNKLRALNILNDFDRMKNDYTSWDKKQVECLGINISNQDVISMNCSVYTTNWQTADILRGLGIPGDTGSAKTSVMEWSSITAAASFLNFIEKNSQYNFQLINKPRSFTSETILDGPYVKKTSFTLELKYNNLKNNLSL